jgi:serine phosphatase RsbU (regulator of sigma subunit)
MGQLRGVLRTLGYLESGSPAQILTRTDAAAKGLGVDILASALVAQVERTGPDTATLHWSSAGHPPPVLLTADGPRLLEAQPDRLLGLGLAHDRARADHELALRTGDTLLLYTDGLVEQRGETIDAGLARLLDNLRDARSADLDQLCDLVLAAHPGGTRDDIALLAVRLTRPSSELPV